MAKPSIDRRVARTRALLQQALVSMIGAKGYDAITVEDICAAANVGRSTFYAHYTGKDDLKRSGLDHLRRALLDRQREVRALPGRDRILGFSLAMFEHARDHIGHYQALVGSRGGAVALDTIREILSDLVRRDLAAAAQGQARQGIPAEVVVQHVVGAFMATLTWWLDSGAKLPPERIDAMFRRLTIEGLAAADQPLSSP